jgi:hypothetical protein
VWRRIVSRIATALTALSRWMALSVLVHGLFADFDSAVLSARAFLQSDRAWSVFVMRSTS